MNATESALNAGQLAVLRLVADGHNYRETAALLGISEDAVKKRCTRAADVLGTNHITHTVAVALRRGLLEEDIPMPDQEQLAQATELVVTTQFGSSSMLQRKLGVKYPESERILDRLEALGVVGPSNGAAARDVLIEPGQLNNILAEVRKANA